MKTIQSSSPYIRKQVNTSRMMLDVCIALLPVSIFSVYRFGFDALERILLSIMVMVVLEAVAFGMINRSKDSQNFKENFLKTYKTFSLNNIVIPALSGLIFALIIPSKLPLYGVVVGASFGIIVGKMIFGGTGNNIFNVAAIGRIFVGASLSGEFTNTYVGVDMVSGSTALTAVRSATSFEKIFNEYTLQELFIGNIPGSMGEISSALIILGGAYLLIRRSADIRLMIGSLIPFLFLMIIAGLSMGAGVTITFVLFQLFSGGILFGIVYMITDPVTAPLNTFGRLLYSLIFVSIVVIIRLFGAYPEGVAFAILFANIFASLIDYPGWMPKTWPKFSLLYGAVACTVGVIVFFGFGGY